MGNSSADRPKPASASASSQEATLQSCGCRASWVYDRAECRAAGKPYAVEMVGCASNGARNHGSWFGRLYALPFYLRTRRALRHAPLVLYVTSHWLQQRYPTLGKSFAASDVEIATMSDAEQSAREARLQRIATGEPPVLGTVASLRIRSKGIKRHWRR